MKPWAKAFYLSKAWIQCRLSFLISKHYICNRCNGAAIIVHHKIYLTPQNIHDPNITLNWDNLEALCIDCHNAEHIGKNCVSNGLKFDEEGNLIKI